MSGDVERLAEVIADGREKRAIERHGKPAVGSLLAQVLRAESREFAEDIVASDWLAERDQKMQAAGAALNVLAHGPEHPDMETYARIHNEGWDAAMLAQVAPDPTTADDWLAAHDAEVAARALREAADELPEFNDVGDEPTRWLRARADRVATDRQQKERIHDGSGS